MPHKKEQIPPPAEIAARAIESRDGILIGELLKQITFSKAPIEERSEALQRIALHHAHMTHVVVGVLSTLSISDPVAAKRIAYAVLTERPDRDRDLVYAAAARALIEAHPLDQRDLTVVAACLRSGFSAVSSETLRAIDNLPHYVIATTIEVARAADQTPAMRNLIKELERRNVLRNSYLPPVPQQSAEAADDEGPQPEMIPTGATDSPQLNVSESEQGSSEGSLTTPADRDPKTPLNPSADVSAEQASPPKRDTSPSLTTEQRCLLVPYRVPDIKKMTDADLADAASREKDPPRLFRLLCELTLRSGQQVLKKHMNQIVWLASTSFSTGNRDVRILADVLFAEGRRRPS